MHGNNKEHCDVQMGGARIPFPTSYSRVGRGLFYEWFRWELNERKIFKMLAFIFRWKFYYYEKYKIEAEWTDWELKEIIKAHNYEKIKS